MKSIPTGAMEMLLNLTPLYLVIMAEARMALYGLHILKQPDDPKTESGLLSSWKNVSDPILEIIPKLLKNLQCRYRLGLLE
jgi:hypothetical protein